MIRIGQGFDVHELIENRVLVLGGVTIPFHMGLKGHSDGDVLIHAIVDALLGALSLGDIGKHFPDNEDKYLGISSRFLLKNVFGKLSSKMYKISNIDTTIVTDSPFLQDYIMSMRKNIAEDLHIGIEQINIKAKSGNNVKDVNAQKYITAYANALLQFYED